MRTEASTMIYYIDFLRINIKDFDHITLCILTNRNNTIRPKNGLPFLCYNLFSVRKQIGIPLINHVMNSDNIRGLSYMIKKIRVIISGMKDIILFALQHTTR